MSVTSISSDSIFFESDYSERKFDVTAKIIALKVASYLNHPICKVREHFYTLYTLDTICKTTVHKVIKSVQFVLGMILFGVLAPLTAPFGSAIRGMVAAFQSEPYIYLQRPGEGKVLPENKIITVASHNVCYMLAGFSITDGGISPPTNKERLDANIHRHKQLDSDVLSLFEVVDIYDAEYISSKLPGYPFIIPVAGMRAIGPHSMMYIASKYEIDSIEFVPFVKDEELTGYSKHSEKGFLSFDLKSEGKAFACVIATHMQHSDIPSSPEPSDVAARAAELRRIANQIKRKVDQGLNVIFTGDLNLEENELKAFLSSHKIDWLKRDPSVYGVPTWGGDEWCSGLAGRASSGPLVLDYTFIAGKAVDIATRVIRTGFSGKEYRPEAGSDHDILSSSITVG